MDSAVPTSSSAPVADKQKIDECWRAAALAAQRADPDADSEFSDFESHIEEKDKRANLFFETRISDAERLKARGNELFKNGEFRRALRRYRKGLYYSHFDELQLNFELQETHREAVSRVDHPLRLNASACLLQLQRFAEAEEMVSEILTKDKNHSKALFRRCHARLGRLDYDGAEDDAQQMLKLEPGNAAALELLQHVSALRRKHLSEVRKMWKGKLAQGPTCDGEALTAYTNASQAFHDLNAFDARVEERDAALASQSRPPRPPLDCSSTAPASQPTSHSTRQAAPHKLDVTYAQPPPLLAAVLFELFRFVRVFRHTQRCPLLLRYPRGPRGTFAWAALSLRAVLLRFFHGTHG
jgi:tetratricopeptide (TPR) repeat protein